MIEQFRAKAATKDVSLSGVFSLQQCDLKALPLELENESFDVVTITQVLHHLSNGLDEHEPVYKLMQELGKMLLCQERGKPRHSLHV